MILTCHGQLVKNQCINRLIDMNDKEIIIALPKGRILKQVLPIFNKIGISPEKSFFDDKDRKLKFETNIPNIKLIIVRSFDVATFLIYGAAHIAIIGSDVLEEFNHSEIYSPIDLKVGLCRLVVATTKEILSDEILLTLPSKSMFIETTSFPTSDRSELTNMAQLTEEVGEVARIISRTYGEQSIKENEELNDLGEELADVLFVLLCLANQTGIDLEKSFEKKLKKKSQRDKTRHLSNKN